jgi:hypothetical protein
MNFNQKFKSALSKAFNKEVSMGYDPSDAFKSSAEAKKMIKNGEEDEMEVEGEMEEATGSGSAGGYSAPLFGTIKKENVTEMTTTSSSGSYIYSNVKEGSKKGGLSKGMTLKDIAKKHNPKYDENYYKKLQQELKKGITVEKEHTGDLKLAQKIAMDHLVENPKYYTDLKKFEKGQGKKVEAKEATTSASSGAYSGPAFLAKNKKNWRGGAKPIYSGGQFVQVKKRCKTFPYCNQGDINAVKLTENRLLAEAVENVSKKTGLSQEMILNMILKEIGK